MKTDQLDQYLINFNIPALIFGKMGALGKLKNKCKNCQEFSSYTDDVNQIVIDFLILGLFFHQSRVYKMQILLRFQV
jgi:hypothetical protein